MRAIAVAVIAVALIAADFGAAALHLGAVARGWAVADTLWLVFAAIFLCYAEDGDR